MGACPAKGSESIGVSVVGSTDVPKVHLFEVFLQLQDMAEIFEHSAIAGAIIAVELADHQHGIAVDLQLFYAQVQGESEPRDKSLKYPTVSNLNLRQKRMTFRSRKFSIIRASSSDSMDPVAPFAPLQPESPTLILSQLQWRSSSNNFKPTRMLKNRRRSRMLLVLI
ncbi:hypothetical protein Vadar_021464 [Vaccinium darrowii]|uniref:Uncharacterized protein n=1 Tax=Vaccinium darrowii TaxID=229202 RepID=A0ACB7YG51_9ERIC|nr:hypothetical protein Vadar_021464 [Vaccinium darrowii]